MLIFPVPTQYAMEDDLLVAYSKVRSTNHKGMEVTIKPNTISGMYVTIKPNGLVVNIN